MRPAKSLGLKLGLLMFLVIVGCESNDERLVRVATDGAQRQAEQNRQMAELQQEVAAGSKRLVEAEAHSRQEFLRLQQELQQQQAEVGRRRDELAAERRALAEQPRRDAVIAAAITNVGVVLAALLPLLVCWQLLRTPAEVGDTALSDLLLQELVSDQFLLLSGTPRPALPHQRDAGAQGQDQ